MSLPSTTISGPWEQLFQGSALVDLENALLRYFQTCPRFAGKARALSAVKLRDRILFAPTDHHAFGLLLVDVLLEDTTSETYVLPIAFGQPDGILTVIRSDLNETTNLGEATGQAEFWRQMLVMIQSAHRIEGQAGYAEAWYSARLRDPIDRVANAPPSVQVHRGEQTNSSATLSGQLHAKLYRRLAPGENPELEMGRYLMQSPATACVPAIAGAIEYHDRDGQAYSLAVVHHAVPHEGDGWSWTLSELRQFLMRIPADRPAPSATDVAVPPEASKQIGDYLMRIERLGHRTAELHLALAAGRDPAFVAEPFDLPYQQKLYDTMSNHAHSVWALLRRHRDGLSDETRSVADSLLAVPDFPSRSFGSLLDAPIAAQRIRCHGDYHLGQVLFTGSDFVILDFEGEPDRPLHERRSKSSPLRDVAGMVRSFHYASRVALAEFEQHGITGGLPPRTGALWLDAWCSWTSTTFVRAYVNDLATSDILPSDRAQIRNLLSLYIMDKAFYELSYELNHRPDWVGIPLDALRRMLPTGVNSICSHW